MGWFGSNNEAYDFELFSGNHLAIIGLFFLITVVIFLNRSNLRSKNCKRFEIVTAIFLLMFELSYHAWMYFNGIWRPGRSMPLEMCNIGLILCVVLLITKKRLVFEILFFIALIGAVQAILTPALTYGFPHFRFFHFFVSHMMIVWVTLYFTWVRGYTPTFQSVLKTITFVNLLLPVILYVNKKVEGNYWFLRHKPDGQSLFDVLGPYPWYIFSMEGLLVVFSLLTWLLFRKWKTSHKKNKQTHHPA